MRLQKLTLDAAEPVRAGGASPRTKGAPRPRPLVRRALTLARRIDRLGGTVAAARQRFGGRRLGEYVAAARAPKLLRAATRLAPAPQLRPRPATSALPPGPVARRVEVSREESRAPAIVVVDDTRDAVADDVVFRAPEVEVARAPAQPAAPGAAPATPRPRQEPARRDATPSARTLARAPAEQRQQIAPAPPEQPRREVARTPAEQPRMIMREPEPPPPDLPEDMHFLWSVWQRERPGGRGVLERSRGARIVEGAATQDDATPAPARKRLARQPAPDPPAREVTLTPEGPTPLKDATRPQNGTPPQQRATPQEGRQPGRTDPSPAPAIASERREPRTPSAPPRVADTPTLARHAAPAPEPERAAESHPHQTAPRVVDPPTPTRAADTPTVGAAAASPIAAVVPIRIARRPRADRAHDRDRSEPVRPRVRRAETSRQRHLAPVPPPTQSPSDNVAVPTRPQPRSLLSRIFRKAAAAQGPAAHEPHDPAAAPGGSVTVLARAEQPRPAAPVSPSPPPAGRRERPIARARAKQPTGAPVLSRQFGLPVPQRPGIPSAAAGGYEARASADAHAAVSGPGMPTHAPGVPSAHDAGIPSLHAPGAPPLHLPSAPSPHVPQVPSGGPPGVPSLHLPGATALHGSHMPTMPSAHGLPGVPGLPGRPGAGHAASAGPAAAGGAASDDMYRELLGRLREEQEQLGQIVDEPF